MTLSKFLNEVIVKMKLPCEQIDKKNIDFVILFLILNNVKIDR
jgi:hypothetical protein